MTNTKDVILKLKEVRDEKQLSIRIDGKERRLLI